MAYKAIDAQQKVEAVKKYWAGGNISQISREKGVSRATIYAWSGLAEQTLLDAFKQTRTGPRGKSLRDENECLRSEVKKLYNNYHQLSSGDARVPAGTPPPVCSACGSVQIRKNGTVASKRQGPQQRYSCRECSLSFYVVFKKKS